MGQDAGWKAFGFLVYWEGGGRGLFARGLARTLVCLRYAPPRPENSSMQAPLDGQAPAATTAGFAMGVVELSPPPADVMPP